MAFQIGDTVEIVEVTRMKVINDEHMKSYFESLLGRQGEVVQNQGNWYKVMFENGDYVVEHADELKYIGNKPREAKESFQEWLNSKKEIK